HLTDVTLLGGRSLLPKAPGMLHSGCELPQLFSPNPEDARLVVHAGGVPAVAGAYGDSLPGRGHWFFTPAPLYFALGRGKPEARVTGAGREMADRSAVSEGLGMGLLG